MRIAVPVGFAPNRVVGFASSRVVGFASSRVVGFASSRVVGFSRPVFATSFSWGGAAPRLF